MKGLCFYLFDTDRQSGTGQRLPHTLHTPHCDLLDEAPPCSLTLAARNQFHVERLSRPITHSNLSKAACPQFQFRSCCCKGSIPRGAILPPNQHVQTWVLWWSALETLGYRAGDLQLQCFHMNNRASGKVSGGIHRPRNLPPK